MAFCMKCGFPIEDGNKFCYRCGTPVAWTGSDTSVNAAPAPAPAPAPTVLPTPAPVAAPVQAPLATAPQPVNSGAVAELDRMIGYFSQKQKEYDEYDNCIEELKAKRVQRATMPNGVGFIVSGSVCMGISIIIAIFSIYLYNITQYYTYIVTWGTSTRGDSNVAWWIVLAFISLGAGIALLSVGVSRHRARNRMALQSTVQTGNQTAFRLSQLIRDLNSHYMNFGYCATGSYYTNPKILTLLREKIVSGRAYSIEEAINILHYDAHNTASQLQSYLNTTLSTYASYGVMGSTFFTASSFYLR